MSQLLLQSVQNPIDEGGLSAKLQAGEPEVEASAERLGDARAGVIAAIERAIEIEQERLKIREVLSKAMLAYQHGIMDCGGTWTPMLNVIATALGISIRGLYRILELSSGGSRSDGEVRGAAQKPSETERLRDQTTEWTSDELNRRKRRLETDKAFCNRTANDFRARLQSGRKSDGRATALMKNLMETITSAIRL